MGLSKTANKLLHRTPPVKLELAVDQILATMSSVERDDLRRELESLAAHAMLLGTYLGHRGWGRAHRIAAKAANTARRQTRRIQGYHTSADIPIGT